MKTNIVAKLVLTSSMENLEPLFQQFLWWEEHQDKLDPYDSDNSEWIDNLKKKFEKQCTLLFKADPKSFLELCRTEEFCERLICMVSVKLWIKFLLVHMESIYQKII